MYLALGIATVIYVAVSLGVFGTLTVDKVIESGGTALAVAAQPVLGQAGYWLMTVTALFATSGATNAGLYPAAGLCEQMAATGQFPPALGRRVGGRAPSGLLLTAAIAAILAVGFDLTAIASIGSAIALIVFGLVTVGHLRVREETGARTWVLVLATISTLVVLVAFTLTTLVNEPATAWAIVSIVLLSIAVDLLWKRRRSAQRSRPSLDRRWRDRGAIPRVRGVGVARQCPGADVPAALAPRGQSAEFSVMVDAAAYDRWPPRPELTCSAGQRRVVTGAATGCNGRWEVLSMGEGGTTVMSGSAYRQFGVRVRTGTRPSHMSARRSMSRRPWVPTFRAD